MSTSLATLESATWKLPGTCLRLIDGDTQVFRVAFRVLLPEEVTTIERDFVVRLLEVDTPERDEAGWSEATAFARTFLFESEVGVSSLVPKTVDLRLTGRKDVYGRWLGWALVGGRNLSSDLNASGHGEYRPLAAHLAALEAEG